MPDTIDKARHMIEERLSELEGEAKKLRDALAGLGQRDAKPSKAPAPQAKKRAKPGQREKQLLASIKAHPDYKQADHAREIGVKPSQVYGLVTKLSKDGKIRKSKEGKLALREG